MKDLSWLEEPKKVTLSKHYPGMEKLSFLSQQRPRQFVENLLGEDFAFKSDYKSVLAVQQKTLKKTATTSKSDKAEVKCVSIYYIVAKPGSTHELLIC